MSHIALELSQNLKHCFFLTMICSHRIKFWDQVNTNPNKVLKLLIVWQRFCEPSPDLGFPNVTVRVCVHVRVSILTGIELFHIILTQRVPSLPDTADCKSVHFTL